MPKDYARFRRPFTTELQVFLVRPGDPGGELPAAVVTYLFARKVQRFATGYNVRLSAIYRWLGWSRDTMRDYMDGYRFWHIKKLAEAADYLDEYQNRHPPAVPTAYPARQDFWSIGPIAPKVEAASTRSAVTRTGALTKGSYPEDWHPRGAILETMEQMNDEERETVRRAFRRSVLNQGEPWFAATGMPHPDSLVIEVNDWVGGTTAGGLISWEDDGTPLNTALDVEVSAKWLDLNDAGFGTLDDKFVLEVEEWDDAGRPRKAVVVWALPFGADFMEGFVMQPVEVVVSWRHGQPTLVPEYERWEDVPLYLTHAKRTEEVAPVVPEYWVHDVVHYSEFAKLRRSRRKVSN